MTPTKFEEEHRKHVEFRKNLAQRDAAKATIKQAEATQKMAIEATKQTELVRKTEALKQQEISKKKEIDERITEIKKIFARLNFKISDVELLEGNKKAEEFLKISQEFKLNVTKYREELIDLGESALIEKFIDFEKKLHTIKISINKNPKYSNYIKLKECSLDLKNLLEEKKVIESDIIDLNNFIEENKFFKNRFLENYCNIFNISDEEFRNKLNTNKLNFPKSGFLIVFIRRFLITSGIFLLLGFFSLINTPEFQEEIIPAIIFVAVLIFLVTAFIGRKTAKKRNEISKIEEEYLKFIINEERNKNNLLDLKEKNNSLKDLKNNINLVKKELEVAKKEASKLENNISEIL